MSARRCAALVTLVAVVGLVMIAAIWVPWQPVPGGAPNGVHPETVFSTEQIRRGEGYARWARIWSLSSLAISLLVASLLGFGRAGEALLARLPGRWWVKVALGVLAISLIGRLATLPCSIMLQRHRLANDLSTQSWGGYARDLAVGELVSVVSTSVAILVLIGVARRWQRAWPAIVAALVAALVVVGSFVYPLIVEPLFNDFTSLPDESLRAEIFALADEEGVRIDDVLVADASRRTTTLNAYVSGFGSSRRVVVYDNLIESLPPDQALSVIAHELAHARHNDVLIGTSLGALGGAAGVGLLGLIVSSGPAGRRRSIAEARIVPFVLALTVWGTVASSPLQSFISRQIETRADAVALETTGDPAAFEEMQKTLALRSLSDPTPPALMQWWWGTHPTTLERVALAQSYGQSSQGK